MKDYYISLPDKFIFNLSLPIRISDINYGNHLGHDSLVSILHEARMTFLKKNNFAEANEHFGLIMSALHVVYKNQAFYGDILNISIGVNEVSYISFELCYLVKKDEIEIARAMTKMVCFDYLTQKVMKIPADLASLLKNY
ncbi:MAG TPA: thioesterase family protein [Gammaproteobacteria bacterium]|nr:thioesterase family protein [Gammaproteobacteria bacterium]